MKTDKEERKEEMKAGQEKIDANQARMEEITTKIEVRLKEEMRSTVSAIEDKMEVIVHSIRSERDGQIQRRIENAMERQEIPKEEAAVHTMRAWQEETVASLECKKQGSKELESEGKRREVPTEEAAVKSSGITKTRHRGRHIAAGRRRESKELTQRDWGSREKLAAACRKVSRRAAVAWCKRNFSRNIRTLGNCGSLKKLTVAGRKMIRQARVARCERGAVRRNWITAKVEQGTRTTGTRQESEIGVKDLGCRRPLYLRRKRITADGIREWKSEQPRLKNERTPSEICRETIEPEVVKRATEMSTGLLKMRNWTLWRCRPFPKRKKNPTGSVASRRAGTVRAPATIERVREGKCDREKEKLEKWTIAILLDLLARYLGAARDVQP
jgi:hypothetical protein